jgi:hypothetical protein
MVYSCKKDYTGQWVSIMPGNSFNGWVKDGDNGSFEQSGDTLLLNGKGALYYSGKVHDARFKNFELVVNIKTRQGAVAGLWFHSGLASGYQVLINNTAESEELRKTGSLASVRNVYKSMARNDEWFSLRIRVVDKHITISVNDIFVVDYVEPEAPYRTPENEGKLIAQGSFAVENYTDSRVQFSDIKIIPLPEKEVPDRTDAVDEQNDEIIRLHQVNFPVIDFHVHLKGWNQEQAMDHSRRTGIFYGIAPNCGIGFPVTSDDDVYTFLDTTRNLSCFMAMQGEGREWVDTFSEAARNRFDYVFTDALTFSDHKGRRTRLWIPEEVWVDVDREQYMDIIVDRIVTVLKEEPIDIYVNPTFLPEEMMTDYDVLWTEERIGKVIGVLAERGIALEINARYKIPGAAIIKAAKEAGIRFAFGSNNGDPNIGKLEYCIEMMKQCEITRYDMYFPKPENL